METSQASQADTEQDIQNGHTEMNERKVKGSRQNVDEEKRVNLSYMTQQDKHKIRPSIHN